LLCKKSSRRPSICWTAVLSHHRAYRSVHGGSTGSVQILYPLASFPQFFIPLEYVGESKRFKILHCLRLRPCVFRYSALPAVLWVPPFPPQASRLSPFSAFLAPPYSPLARESSVVRPFPLRLYSRLSGTFPFTVLWPVLTSGRSAGEPKVRHHCMGCSGVLSPCAYRPDLPR
jgi:hypothetical protein